MKLKVTNKFGQPYGINPIMGSRVLAHGDSFEGEFSEGEARNIANNKNVFDVEGYVEPEPGQAEPTTQRRGADDMASRNADLVDLQNFKSGLGPIAERLKIRDSDQFLPTVQSALDDGDKARDELKAIADLFGTPEVDATNVKDAVAKLIADFKDLDETMGHDTNGPSDLAAAVALLDDKNDDHWTQAGQPKISALEKLLGKDTSAADYAALPDEQKRVRKT